MGVRLYGPVASPATDIGELLEELDGLVKKEPFSDRDFLPIEATTVGITGGEADKVILSAARQATKERLLALFAESLRTTDRSRWPNVAKNAEHGEAGEEKEKHGMEVFVKVGDGEPRPVPVNQKLTYEELAGAPLRPGQNLLIFVRTAGRDVPLKVGKAVRFAKLNGEWHLTPKGSMVRNIANRSTCSVQSEELPIPDADYDVPPPNSAQFAQLTKKLNELLGGLLSTEDLDFDRVVADPNIGTLAIMQRLLKFFKDHANVQGLTDQAALISSGIREQVSMVIPGNKSLPVAYVNVDSIDGGIEIVVKVHAEDLIEKIDERIELISDKPLDRFVFDEDEETGEPRGDLSKGEILRRRIEEMDRIYCAMWDSRLVKQINSSPRFKEGVANAVYAHFKTAAEKFGLKKSALRAYLVFLIFSRMASLECPNLGSFIQSLDKCTDMGQMCAVIIQFSGQGEQISKATNNVGECGGASAVSSRGALFENITTSIYNGEYFDEMLRRMPPEQAKRFRGFLLPAYFNACKRCGLGKPRVEQLAGVFLSQLVRKVMVVDLQITGALNWLIRALNTVKKEADMVGVVNIFAQQVLPTATQASQREAIVGDLHRSCQSNLERLHGWQNV
ncbi:hypothetical protein HZA42_05270 [Candidatus Peregrinibacteria bacterium]|nr:hypothetical protein [Candidatus Peregrinibacteria bacterium]